MHVRIAVLETLLESSEKARGLQAMEYERRLTELNHAHAQAAQNRTKYVSNELFYSKIDAFAAWKSEMDTWRSRIGGIAFGIGAVSGLVTSLIMRFFSK